MNYKHLYYFWWVAKTGSAARASEQLHLTAHTISGQIGLLEEDLGTTLFKKKGRNLVLTQAGKLALNYASDIFALGAELEDSVRNFEPAQRQTEFRIGVSDSVPKAVAGHLIDPALHLNERVRLVCREWKLESLLTELAAHRLDLVIADAPIPSSVSVRAYNHRLGKSPISFFANPALAKKLKGRFPAKLNQAPLLVPGPDAALRQSLDQWINQEKLRPHIVGEFDDSALMKAFGQRGTGVFIGPTIIEKDIRSQYKVKVIGRTDQVVEHFYAISVERRVTHPCVVAITGAARNHLFA
jgi:LysR family transcriptional activator of nhaA